ncbi:MAG: ACR3 family arsenite efflux transporter [Bifidobacterium mongoliense]|jgi:ACR3 family arsenite transporter|uniref:ACR3 family arsenite efflux transporter n=1 Tax=Bifidobacterium mongoliense TaxID=518643 RepID=UPI002F352CCF
MTHGSPGRFMHDVDPANAGNGGKSHLRLADRLLPIWILAAMAVGIVVGRAWPGLATVLGKVTIGRTSLPIAVGLFLMMYPPLAKVRYRELGGVTRNHRLLIASIILNWVVGPALMFALAWLLLPDLPQYRTGVIIIGLARCIAMVLIWNDLACGDTDAAAVLVALNALFQIAAFSLLGWFYLHVLPGWLGLPTASANFSFAAIAISVVVFLGVPLVAGWASRRYGERIRGRQWYEQRFLPMISPMATWGLLFTVIMLFALQGNVITRKPLDVVRIALPLLIYFAIMFAAGFVVGIVLHLGYGQTTTLAFTGAGNNFELAIAVCVGTFGMLSGQALAGTVGPLIEVPALLSLVYVALRLRRSRWFSHEANRQGRDTDITHSQG